ncbi:27217_t:CDS:10 [Dentiscutata erythropus]|uniref:27217_t:CDS:1 n=1 Tax=Dentiscutata erythropus TaxID=1348616 RepID=A0A9N9NG97_9GLOM|nr:27217_t:CDS:10 [Dentiscutata erythropus]
MIFNSKYPDVKVPQVGIYQYVTSNPNKIPDDKVIYVDAITGKSYTFGEFKHESKKFAAGLQDKLEFKRGDVLAIFSPNQLDYPIVLLGAIAAGGTVTTANPKFETADLSNQLTDSGASVFIVHPECLEVAIEASINAKIPASRVLLFGDEEMKGYKPYRSILISDREIEPVSYTPEEAKSTTAYLLYSSGTTGKPKGIELTHTNLAVNLAQLMKVESKVGPHSVITGVTQFCHGYALIGVIHATLIRGATAIVHSGLNVETLCESIQKFRINHIYGVPPVIHKLVNDPLAQQFDLSSVDTIVCGASPLSDKFAKKFYEMFRIPVLQIYGLTEASLVLRQPDTMENVAPGSIGILCSNIKAKLLSENGRGYNEPGELWIHGPNIMKGYLNNKKATNAVFDKDGFFNTGDIVSIDEQGNFILAGRKKELIKFRDFHVIPFELESILLKHDAVSGAVVIGYYSEEEATEIPIAYVTIKNGHEQSQTLAKKIQSFVDEKVASYKRLRGGVLFIDRIPQNEFGKIQRGELREKLKNDINIDRRN